MGRGRLRASDADREQVIDTLKAAFVQGWLTRDQLGERAGQALVSRTYAELAAATDGIPARLIGAEGSPALPVGRGREPVVYRRCTGRVISPRRCPRKRT